MELLQEYRKGDGIVFGRIEVTGGKISTFTENKLQTDAKTDIGRMSPCNRCLL